MLVTAGRLEVSIVSDPWLRIDNIATYLRVTKDTVYARIAESCMPAHKAGRMWKFQTTEMDEWVSLAGDCLYGLYTTWRMDR